MVQGFVYLSLGDSPTALCFQPITTFSSKTECIACGDSVDWSEDTGHNSALKTTGQINLLTALPTTLSRSLARMNGSSSSIRRGGQQVVFIVGQSAGKLTKLGHLN